MAITESIRNLSFPSITDKEVTLELEKSITTDSEGDERYLLSAIPGTTTLGVEGASIDPLLIEFSKAGYVRSSGFKTPPFTITSVNNTFRISIDGSTFRDIILDSGVSLTGQDVEDDMQVKINALAATGGVEEGNIAFLNSIVTFVGGKFEIISGSLSKTYTGVNKSSVAILPGLTNDVTVTLGMDLLISSEELASKVVAEAFLTGATSETIDGEVVIPVDDVTELSEGLAYTIYNGSDRHYFIATSISGNSLITHSGSVPTATYSGGALVQNIFERDPDLGITSPYESVDDLLRALVRSIAVQIDFTE
jgi:hypothetical protein